MQANNTTIVLNLHKWNNFLNENVSVFWNFDIIHSTKKIETFFDLELFVSLCYRPHLLAYFWIA